MQKKSIVIVGPLPPPYHGITVSTRRLLDSRLREEFRLIHFDTSDHRDLDNIGKFDFSNVSISLSNVAKLAWLCLRKRPDVVYLTVNRNIAYARDGLFILVAKVFGGSRVVIHLRGAHFVEAYEKYGPPARWFANITLRMSDKAIVLGECLRYNFRHWFAESDIHVVPNGTPFNPDVAGKLAAPSGERRKIVIAYLGNLIEEKGVVDVVRSVPLVAGEFPDVEFRFAGDWWNTDEAKRKCEEEIGKHNLQPWIRFLGVVTGGEKERLLREADIFVFPTYYRGEGHPNVIIEAMAAALPVISTDYVAISETVVDGVTGFLVPARDPETVAERIKRLIRDPALRTEMGKAGRLRYEACYTQDKNIGNMSAVFRSAMALP
jgi:glycosyltransferase involved in cell wall biosynthesis